jgi:hypothetical protein
MFYSRQQNRPFCCRSIFIVVNPKKRCYNETVKNYAFLQSQGRGSAMDEHPEQVYKRPFINIYLRLRDSRGGMMPTATFTTRFC